VSRRSLTVACLALIASLIPLSPAGARTATVHGVLGQQLLGELNAERAARGLAGLGWEPSVAAASAGWAGHLHTTAALRHSNNGRAEIVGHGIRTGQITEAWMRSPSHRRLMVDPNMALAGVGVSCDAGGRLWAVIQFVKANPARSAPAATPAGPRVTPGHSGLSCGGQEGTERAIRRLYLAYFGRDADPGGLAHWSGLAARGHSLASISSQFAVSAEFHQRYGALNDEQFVHRAYHNVLGRAPDPGGLRHWLAILRHHGRGAVMVGFSESHELRIRSGLH
jgi:hypothetical protein